jgi:hypothetical protein
VFCLYDGEEMQETGIEHQGGYECPTCKRVLISGNAPTETGAIVACVFIFPDRLSAAGAVPTTFQQSLF